MNKPTKFELMRKNRAGTQAQAELREELRARQRKIQQELSVWAGWRCGPHVAGGVEDVLKDIEVNDWIKKHVYRV